MREVTNVTELKVILTKIKKEHGSAYYPFELFQMTNSQEYDYERGFVSGILSTLFAERFLTKDEYVKISTADFKTVMTIVGELKEGDEE